MISDDINNAVLVAPKGWRLSSDDDFAAMERTFVHHLPNKPFGKALRTPHDANHNPTGSSLIGFDAPTTINDGWVTLGGKRNWSESEFCGRGEQNEYLTTTPHHSVSIRDDGFEIHEIKGAWYAAPIRFVMDCE